MRVHSKEKLFSFISVFSAWHDFGIWVSSISQTMCLHSSTNKRQLPSFRSLKSYHALAFGRFLPRYQSWSQVCLSPLTHTWLIESGIYSCPCHLVLIERVEEKRPLFPQLIRGYYYTRLWPACRASFPRHPTNVWGCHISSSQYILTFINQCSPA